MLLEFELAYLVECSCLFHVLTSFNPSDRIGWTRHDSDRIGLIGLAAVAPQLRKWADLMLVAPLSANTLAKLANGLCDNLVVRTVR